MDDQQGCTPLMLEFARRYIWWQTPEKAVAMPARVIAQVMTLGTVDDVEILSAQVGEGTLREVLATAEAGWFDERSWHYWHFRLGLAVLPEQVPPLPARFREDAVYGRIEVLRLVEAQFAEGRITSEQRAALVRGIELGLRAAATVLADGAHPAARQVVENALIEAQKLLGDEAAGVD